MEYKFRGRRLDNGEWVTGLYCLTRWPHLMHTKENKAEVEHYDKCRQINGREWFAAIQDEKNMMNLYEVDPATVSMSTGLRDSKRTEEYPDGQEIFKGDICRVTSCMDEECIGEVVWDEKYLCWAVDIGEELYGFHDIVHCEHIVEVIGSIYENPELLEGRE